MKKKQNNVVLIEIVWLIGILLSAAIVEYSIIKFFDLHPVLSVKIQGFIGLLLIGYSVRMVARLWKHYHAQNNDMI